MMSRELRCHRRLCFGFVLAAAMSLQSHGQENDELVQMVIGLIGESDKEMRSIAFEQVRSEAKGKNATEKFANLLPTLAPDAQAELLSALADRGDAAALPAVKKMIVDSDQEAVKVAAIRALGDLGGIADLPALVDRLASDSDTQKKAVRSSLVRLKGDAVSEAIAKTMNDSAPPIQVELIDILTVRRASKTIPTILKLAISPEASVRMAAMKSLGQIASAEHVAGMVAGVLKADRGSERVAAEKQVMFVCSRIEDKESRAAPVLAAMAKLGNDEKVTVLSTLGRIGGSDALAEVNSAIESSNGKLHSAGIQAISNWPDASIAARLKELATKEQHANHQTTALRALIRVVSLADERSDDERLTALKIVMTMCRRDAERNLVLRRAAAIRSIESLRFMLPYMENERFAEQACLTIVELAHHRGVRHPNKTEVYKILDRVIEVSKDPVVVDRANRYKNEQTWVRPKK